MTLPSTPALKHLLQRIGERSRGELTHSIELAKSGLVEILGPAKQPSVETLQNLRRLTALGKELPEAGNVLAFGSDYLDSLSRSYKQETQKAWREVVMVNAYVGLHSLITVDPPHTSSLLDQLFDLKRSADEDLGHSPRSPTLLSALLCWTPFLRQTERSLTGSNQKRGLKLLESLHVYGAQMMMLHPKRLHREKHTQKAKHFAIGEKASNGVHVHKMSLITQVQDLFPDIGSGYIVKLLDAFSDDVEQVTAHLLEPESLPSDLQYADKSEILAGVHEPSLSPKLTPPSSPPLPSRRNVFDDDDFSNLRILDSQLHYGRKDATETADTILSDRSQHSTNKAAILSALAAFDSDDDERDDTYDVADVGGTVDSGLPGSDDAETNPLQRESNSEERTEEMLFRAYKSDPEQFGRSAATRRGKGRETLKRDTGMTDESIEGWAVMLLRDHRRMTRLEAKYALSGGRSQTALVPTAYRRPDSGTATEESDVEVGEQRVRGGFRGRVGARGSGRGRGRGRGDVAGPANETATQVARQKKDTNKGSGANHNRRDQRAKKLARAGFPA